jgi:hypothetical protein
MGREADIAAVRGRIEVKVRWGCGRSRYRQEGGDRQNQDDYPERARRSQDATRLD